MSIYRETENICLSEDGNLILISGQESRIFDFNKVYYGFYPKCFFTAVYQYRNLMYAAGIDVDQRTHLFTSATGIVWQEEIIVPYTDRLLSSAYGAIVAMVSIKEDQMILVSKNGYIITLPGCPKCVSVRHYNHQFIGADREADMLRLICDDGEILRIPSAIFLQYRTSWSYAESWIQKGALLLAIGEKEYALPGAVFCDGREAFQLLRQSRKEDYIFCCCESGSQADSLVEYARYCGYIHVFSLGGKQHLREQMEEK